MEACGTDQLCSGVKAGIEGAVHTINKTFQENCDAGWGLLLSDGDNAFNSMSRVVFLWNARILWPRCAIFLFNSYRGFAILVIRGSETCFLFSKEGCTQGSGLAMQAYAIGNLPFIHKLKNPAKWIQNWYADDGSCLGPFDSLKEWLQLLSTEGPKYGYYNQITKNVLIVAPDFLEKAHEAFHNIGVQIVTGHRVLGGFIGSDSEKETWLEKKLNFWTNAVQKLSQVGKQDPHAAFIAMSKSLQNEWNYMQRVVCAKEETFLTLKEVICLNFLPAISGFEISNSIEFDIMLRPTRFGGTGIRDPVKTAATSYQTSFDASYILSKSILKGCPQGCHNIHSNKIAQQSKNLQEEKHQNDVNHLIDRLPEQLCDFQHACNNYLESQTISALLGFLQILGRIDILF